MNDRKLLLANIDNLHTTEMGVERIKRNTRWEVDDMVSYCKKIILNENTRIYKKGKNWYCETDDVRITINSHSYTIITAHLMTID